MMNYENGRVAPNQKRKGIQPVKGGMDLNLARESLSNYENGKRNPDLETLVLLSKYFDKSIDFLITGEEFKN